MWECEKKVHSHARASLWTETSKSASGCDAVQSVRQSAVLLLLVGVMLRVTLLELFDTSCGIYKFLLTGKKRMAGRTDLNFHFINDRSELEFRTTGTASFDLFIFRMYIVSHGSLFLQHNYCVVHISA